LKATIDVTIEVEIDRPPADVWALMTDTERLPEWLGEWVAAREETDGPTRLGTVVRYTLEQGNRSGTIEIVEWDPPHRMGWEGEPLRWAGGGARPRGLHTLTETGPGRTLFVGRYRPELTGTQALLKPFLQRWVRKHRLESARTLKALLESSGARSAAG
jgi:uncharacterized protein YndB with AHSA1/START domain